MSSKDTMIQFRIGSADKELIRTAAELRGLQPSTYIRHHAVAAANDDLAQLQDHRPIRLSASDWERFVDIMASPPSPCDELVSAAREFFDEYPEET